MLNLNVTGETKYLANMQIYTVCDCGDCCSCQ